MRESDSVSGKNAITKIFYRSLMIGFDFYFYSIHSYVGLVVFTGPMMTMMIESKNDLIVIIIII